VCLKTRNLPVFSVSGANALMGFSLIIQCNKEALIIQLSLGNWMVGSHQKVFLVFKKKILP
jgi:hypothetical protein